MNKFSEIAARLGAAYDAYKAAELEFAGKKATKTKPAEPGVKQEFLDEATKANETATLARKTVSVDTTSEEEAVASALKRNPRWRLVKTQQTADGNFLVLLEENPKFKEFVYVDKKGKRVWTKQVVDGSPYLDEVELQEKDPELWKKVSRMERVFVGVEGLTPELLAEIEDYIYPGTPTVKLAQPRKAKTDEL